MADAAKKCERNIYQRLHAVMGEIPNVKKVQNAGMPYPAVMHNDVMAAVKPSLLRHGVYYYATVLSWGQDGNRTHAEVQVNFVNIDNPSEVVPVVAFGYGNDTQDKGPGKAISYGTKYALLKGLGMETGDDSDKEQIPHTPSETPVRGNLTPKVSDSHRDLYGKCTATAMIFAENPDGWVKTWLKGKGATSLKTATTDQLEACLEDARSNASLSEKGKSGEMSEQDKAQALAEEAAEADAERADRKGGEPF